MDPPSSTRRRPEVLAPAGDDDSLRAAVRAGADAVYFGLGDFNARARARNFDVARLTDTLAFVHASGVKGYVALNTLVFDPELSSVEAVVRACAAADVDAVIVQDLGVIRMVRAVAPGLPVHASTQMTCTDAASVQLAAALGASRVILARELSLEDIAAIRRQTSIELEVFVHGALCVSYSGQCLTSEAIGGRSANRGACAQACRLPYELVVDGVARDLDERAFLLSPGDLEASGVVPRLVGLGVASLKIEGRLKGAAYVAATTMLYRRAVDAALGLGLPPDRALRETALQMFSRGSGTGFLEGVDHQRLVEGRSCDHRGPRVGTLRDQRFDRGRALLAVHLEGDLARGDGVLVEGGFAGNGELGGRVWGISRAGQDVERATSGDEVMVWLGPDKSVSGLVAGRRVFKTSDPARERAVLAQNVHSPCLVPIAVRVTGTYGAHAVLEASTARGAIVRVETDAVIERASVPGRMSIVLREKLARLGGTAFVLSSLESLLPDDALLPVSCVNRARRALVEQLTTPSRHAWPAAGIHARDLLEAAQPPTGSTPLPAGLFVLCRTLEQAEAAMEVGADGVYLDFLELTGTGNAVRALRARGAVQITLVPPRIRKPGDEKIDDYLASLEPDAMLVRSLGALHAGAHGRNAGVPRVGDFSLNVTNRIAAAEVLSRGALSAFTPSFDLDATQLTTLLDSSFAAFAEVVVHHPLPLFHMEHCVMAALLSTGKDHRDCGRPCEHHQVSLRDRAGMDHPVEADVGCRNTVFHAAAQSAAGLVGELSRRGVRRFRIELVREARDDVRRLVAAYRALLAGRSSPDDVWRSLRTEGGYGVVRGTLRVL